MKVIVTKKDIANGKQRSYDQCPIALALKRRCKARFVRVGPLRCLFSLTRWSWESTAYDLPRAATHFIMNFDEGRPVRPLTFHLDTKRQS